MTRTQTHPIRLRWAIGLVVLGLLAVLLPAQRAAADHTPIPSTVTLVGSLQSELGCPGDWQPECAATHLEPVRRPARGLPGHLHRAGGQLRVQGRAERLLGRELRGRRRSRRGQPPDHLDGRTRSPSPTTTAPT